MRDNFFCKPYVLELLAKYYLCGDIGQADTYNLGHKRHCSRGTRIDFQNEYRVFLYRELNIDKADDVKAFCEHDGLLAYLILYLF